MEQRIYETTPPVPLPPPDPAELRVFYSERLLQEQGKGWVRIAPGEQGAHLFFKERYALLHAGRELNDG